MSLVRNQEGGSNLHERWTTAREHGLSYADVDHPFRYQMGRVFSYQLFLEHSISLLRTEGRCGLIVPSGLYSDSWSRPLRGLLLDRCRWEWLFSIENRERIFPIHRSYKFNPVIVEKGGATESIRAAFMRRNLDDWEHAVDFTTPYTREQVDRFSPRSRVILEIQSKSDLDVLEKIYSHAVLLGDDGPEGWRLKYKIEFMMNTDARLFPPRPQWEERGYRPDEYSRWLLGDWRPIEELWDELRVDPSRPEPVGTNLEGWLFDTTAGPGRREAEGRVAHGHQLKPGDIARSDCRSRCAPPPYDQLPIPRASLRPGVLLSRDGTAWIREERIEDTALPFYEGRMIGMVDFSQKGWVSGKGRQSVWREIPWSRKQIEPQYLMALRDYVSSGKAQRSPKISYMRVSSSTNTRTTIASYLGRFPTGDSVFHFVPYNESLEVAAVLSAIFCTFAFDSVVRYRLGGLNMSEFVLAESALPRRNQVVMQVILALAREVNFVGPIFSREQIYAARNLTKDTRAIAPARRLQRLCTIDALVACWLGLSFNDLRFLLSDCDLPSHSSENSNPKGFWRVDKDKDPELRHTVLTLVAFHDLESKVEAAGGDCEKGIETFLAQNQGEGWMLPETLCLADYGLGHDDRAWHPQPVASRLGPRFYDWQLVQSTEESWHECHLHARNLLGGHEYALLLVELVERHAAEGEDYLDRLTDGFTRTLLGDDGYLTVLLEICSRGVADEEAYWTMVTTLRNGGHLDDAAYGQLLDGLHSRGHLDDIGYRRRRRYLPPSPSAERWLRVAEDRADYRATTPPDDRQPDLFE